MQILETITEEGESSLGSFTTSDDGLHGPDLHDLRHVHDLRHIHDLRHSMDWPKSFPGEIIETGGGRGRMCSSSIDFKGGMRWEVVSSLP